MNTGEASKPGNMGISDETTETGISGVPVKTKYNQNLEIGGEELEQLNRAITEKNS